MLTYKTNDLITKATMLCDLKNNSFLTNEMSVQLLNDSYIQCYQKLIDIKNDDFLISADIEDNSELPDNLYQVAEVYYIYKDNPFRKYNLVKNKDYIIRNNKIKFNAIYVGCQYCLDYYPIPETLTLNDSGKDSHNFDIFSLGLPYNTVHIGYNLCAQIGKYIYYAVYNTNTLYRIEYGKTNYRTYTLSSNITDFFCVNDYLAISVTDKYYKFDKSGNYTEVTSANAVNVYNDTTKAFSYDSTVVRAIIFSDTTKSFTGSDNKFNSIKYKDSSFIIGCIGKNLNIITDSVNVYELDNVVFVSKVTDSKHYIYTEIINNDYTTSSFKYTQIYTPSEGTSILTVPNNAFYSLLSYDLAIMIKTIAGEDINALSALRENAYMTFCDTMKKDITPYVIEDVYSNKGWWY